jgi:hypothetical protein
VDIGMRRLFMIKSLIFFLSCWLALSSAFAVDPFGKATGPVVPSPSVPATTPAPAGPSAATLLQQALGPLQGNLKAWFSFDKQENGGLAWSAEPLTASFSGSVVLRDVERGRVADFSAKDAIASFSRPFVVGKKYTLAVWASFPMANEVSIFFRGGNDTDVLNVKKGQLGCWLPGNVKERARGFGPASASLSGWHHLALSVDGASSTLYLDGRLQGSVSQVITEDLISIGAWSSPGPIDDVLIFNRNLGGLEIAKVMQVKFPAPPKAP